MRLIVFLIVCVSHLNLLGQSLPLDSLETRLPETEGKERVQTLNNISLHYVGRDPHRLLELAEESIALAKEVGYRKGEMLAYNNRAIGLAMSGRLDESEESFNKCLEIALERSDSSQISSVYDNLGNVYHYKGDYRRSLEMKFKGLEMKERLGVKPSKVVMSQVNIANILDMIGNKERAMNYYRDALEGATEIGDSGIYLTCIINLGVAYSSKNKDSSMKYIERSIDYAKALGDRGTLATGYASLASMARGEERLHTALDYYKKVYQIRQELSDVPGIINAANNVGQVLTDLKRYKEAKEYLEEGVKLARENGLKLRLYEGLDGLADLYANTGDYKKAFEYKDEFAEIRDSVLNEDLNKQLSELEVLYQSAKKQQEIEALQHENELEQERSAKLEKERALSQAEIERNRWMIGASSAGLLMALVFGVFVYRAFKRKKKDNHKLEIQKGEIKEQRDVIQVKNKEITDSIVYAKRIQDAILPPMEQFKTRFKDSFVLYKPKDIVAGDFYWIQEAQKQAGKVIFAAADCTGHGVPGAIVSVICNNALNRSVNEFNLHRPGEILDKTSEIVEAELGQSSNTVRDGMDIAIVSLIESKEGNYHLEFSGANNPLWLIRNGHDKIEEVKGDKRPVGMSEKTTPFATHTIELKTGDSFYIFSDGYADQFGGTKGKKLKSLNFKKLLLSVRDKSMEDQCSQIDRSFESWRGDFEQLDDVCVIGVKL